MVHHYRKLTFVLLLGACILVGLSPPVLADEPVVEITVSVFVVGAPEDFALTYISDFEVGISWTKGGNADNTMVRAKYGSYPEGRYDGYLVYYGNGTSTSDTAVSLDETTVPVYYRAWSEAEGGTWSSSWAEAFMEVIGVTLFAFAALCIVFTVAPWVFRATWPLLIVAVLAWIGLGIYLWSFDVGSMQWTMGWVCVMAALFVAFDLIRRILSARPARPTDDDEQRDYARQVRKVTKKPRRY